MSADAKASDFFVAGGTLHPDARSYVKRPADDELFELALAGKFCYVLTPRQMGKSSLMVRTAHRLQEQEVSPAILDLTSIGTDVSAEQWYLGLIARLKSQLKLSVNPGEWWARRAHLSAVQRFTDFLRDAVLAEIEGPVVIFMDEIDTMLNLDFSDDFFAAIRFAYNARASDPAYDRLVFVLLGVAAPADLIKDPERTPFNIGHGIDLREFTREDAQVLQRGLQVVFPEQGENIFARIYHWTNGHPYLTQTLCMATAERRDGRWTDERVDGLVERLFLSEEARRETNLRSMRDKILNHPRRRQLLALYRKVYTGKRIDEDERSPIQNQLKLSGLVKAENGYLDVRNQIYRRAFDLTWIRENTLINPAYVVAGVAVFVALLAVGSAFHNTLACSFFPRERWCPQNDRYLTGKIVLTLADCDDGTLFAGTVDGIYRRAPGHTVWTREESTGGEVRGLAASPDCGLVYAAALYDGVLRRDADSWSSVSEEDMTQAWTVALSGNMILAGGEFGVRYSEASKVSSWEKPTASPTLTVVSLVRSDGQIYAAAWGDGVWYCSEDNLDQWEHANGSREITYTLQAIGPLTEGAPRLAGVDDGLYRWNDTQWITSPKPWGETRTFWLAIDGVTVYAGQENNGVLRSADEGATWEQINTGWETPPFRVRSLLIHIDEDERRWLYAGTSNGVWRYLLPKVPLQVLLCNGAFENNFDCWQHGGELDQSVECGGDGCFAVLGNPNYECEGGVPVGEAWIKQTVQVSQGISPTLSLRYRVFSYDLNNYDSFLVKINGKPVGEYGNTEWETSSCNREAWDSGWQSVEFDLHPYIGEEVELSLHDVNGEHGWWNTWAYVDDVEDH
jgi:hypothetical protein